MPVLSSHSLFGYLTDETGKSFYVDMHGNIQLSTTPRRMRNLLEGWIEMQMQWSRNSTFLGVDRVFTNQFKAVKSSAAIVRHLLYTGYTTENKVFFLYYKKDLITGVYEVYGRPMEVDLLECEDTESGVSIRLAEGGIAKYIKANSEKTYEIPFGKDQLLMDGIILQDTFNYEFYEYESFGAGDSYIGLSYINNEGDNVGITKSSQSAYTPFDEGLLLAESGNYFFSSTSAISIQITGKIRIKPHPDKPTDTEFLLYLATDQSKPYLETGLTHAKPLVGGTDNGNQNYLHNNAESITLETEFNFNTTFSLLPNEKLFMIVFNQNDTYPFTVVGGSFKVKFESRNPNSICSVMRSTDLFAAIIDNVTEGKYKATSNLLKFYEGRMFTSGDALRQLPDAKIKISLSQFFRFWFARGAALGTDQLTQTAWLEDQTYTYDNTNEIVNIGEVSAFKRTIYKERIFSSIKIGSQDKTYEERAGRLEVNSEQEYSTPVTRQQRELDLRSNIRTDAYGIEFLRSKLFLKETTDSESDNEVFAIDALLNVTRETDFIINTGGEILIPISDAQGYFIEKANFSILGTAFNDGDYTVISSRTANGYVYVQTNVEGTVNEIVTATLISYVHNISRPIYNPMTGVPATYFNVAFSPKRGMFESQQYWAGGIISMQDKLVEFKTAKKNANVHIGGIIENNNIQIGSLVSYYRPIMFEFETNVPIDIVSLMNQRGYITFSRNGVELHGFVEDVSVKPAYNDVQTWKVLCSSLTSVESLAKIENAFLQITDKGMISHKNPLKFVPAGLTYPLQYHFKQMDIEWHANRINRFSQPTRYYQKWQINDTTNLQIIVKDASIELGIYDCFGKLVQVLTPTAKSDQYVKAPWVIYEILINFGLLAEGLYTVQLTVGVGDTAKYFLSEPFLVGKEWKNTVLIEYWNSINTVDMVFTTGFRSKIRVEGGLPTFNPRFKRSGYEDELMNTVTLVGRKYRNYDLVLGDDGFGLPDWMADKIAAILAELDTKFVDGMQFDLQPESELERREIPGSPNADYSISIRESRNMSGIPIDGVGIANGELTVEYHINTRAFTGLETPVANQQDTIVHVEEIE